MTTRVATQNDIQGILDLQGINLFENLSESEREKGFVTTPFTISQLNELLNEHGLFVSEVGGKIKGYTMAAGWKYFSQWSIFPYMISRLCGIVFKGINISDQNSFQYGPICIDSSLRGTEAFPCLFEKMRLDLSSRYSVGITFINKINERSYKAHVNKLGMMVVDEFEFGGREYYSLVFSTAIKVS